MSAAGPQGPPVAVHQFIPTLNPRDATGSHTLMVRDILRAQRDRGATVFLNYHLLGEIEITCDRVVFIKEGEVVATEDLRNRSQDESRVLVHEAIADTLIERIAGAARVLQVGQAEALGTDVPPLIGRAAEL